MRAPIITTGKLRMIAMVLVSLTGWISLGWIVSNTDPGETSRLLANQALNRLAFFGSLFTGIFGTASLVAYYLTHRIYPLRRDQGDLPRALQEGGAVAAAVTGLAILRTVDQLSLLSAVLVIMTGIVAFTYALTRK